MNQSKREASTPTANWEDPSYPKSGCVAPLNPSTLHSGDPTPTALPPPPARPHPHRGLLTGPGCRASLQSGASAQPCDPGAEHAPQAGVLPEPRGDGCSRSRTPGHEPARAVPLPGPAPPHAPTIHHPFGSPPCNVTSPTALISTLTAAGRPPHKMQAPRTAERLLTGLWHAALTYESLQCPQWPEVWAPRVDAHCPRACRGPVARCRPAADTVGHQGSRKAAPATCQRPEHTPTRVT